MVLFVREILRFHITDIALHGLGHHRMQIGITAKETGAEALGHAKHVVNNKYLPVCAIARADETIRGYMGTSATMTSGEQSGAVIRGVFDDPENISYAGQGVRVEGSSPSLFVRTDDVRQLRRGDTLTIGEENFWIDRISPDDGGSCHLWLGRGVPPAVNRRR